MLPLALSAFGNASTVLCIGAHCDDVEIGCGATLVRLAREHPQLSFVWGIFAGSPARELESRAAAAALVPAERLDLRFFRFRESYFPSQHDQIKDAFETLKLVNPQLILTHRLEDRHQDHRVLAELTWNTFRSHLILEYEIPKYDADLGQPNFFVPLSLADLDYKVATLHQSFPSQHARAWFTPETFRALARIRGIECAAPGGYAEAFHARKICV